MPRNGNGKYSLPANYIATTGETITAIQHNSPLTDIAADLNAVRPVTSGGTGGATAAAARTALGLAIGTNVAAYADRVPSGLIAMWSGAINTIPTGWNLCDGTNSTPDLTNMFIVGAGDTYDIGDTGGENTHTLTEAELPKITPTFTGAPLDAHGHPSRLNLQGGTTTGTGGGLSNDDGGTVQNYSAYAGTPNDTLGHQIGGVSAGTPSGTISSFGSGDAHENRPPYYALAFIMKS